MDKINIDGQEIPIARPYQKYNESKQRAEMEARFRRLEMENAELRAEVKYCKEHIAHLEEIIDKAEKKKGK